MPLQAGFDKYVAFKPNGAGAAVIIHVHKHNYSDKIDRQDVTHSGTNGRQALLATVLRGDGGCEMTLDSSTLPAGTTYNLVPGTNGIFRFLVAPSKFFDVPVMVTEVNYVSEVAGKVTWNTKVELNELAAASPETLTFARPT